MGTHPNDPMPDYGQGYRSPPQEPQSNDVKVLALAGLILGTVALVLLWIPLVNYVSLVLALVGLGLSIASLVIVRRRATATGLPIAAVIVSAVALVAAIVATVFWGALFNSVDGAIDNPLVPVTVTPTATATSPSARATPTSAATPGSAPVVPPPAAPSSAATPGSAPAVPPPAAPSSAATPGSAPAVPNTEVLPLGADAEVGEYTVTVSSVQLDATDAILGFNRFNDPPEGQYVLITLDVVYTGTEEGNPWIDLTTKFVGSDSRQYGESTCMASLDLPAFDVPTLENGGTGQFEVCMDVPAAAIPGKRVLVEDNTSFAGTEASWQTQ
ncbi:MULTISPECIES: hypothetical protein [unclassified Arthrobacter]|uniref:hypothetical protein n=1 Tax=unclassified Arthrobacter TaxID=235627 RepID=UPI0011B071CB|nr:MULTISPECIES: hypothetical protein [unclassified Arthrobacter]